MFPESPEEEQAIRNLQSASDRVAAIVGATFIETRLTRFLKGSFVQDDTVLKDLFQPSGQLGAFGTKISMVYILAMVTEQTYKDLICIKKVRNEFADEIEAQSFARNDISKLCMNIKIAEMHTHQMFKTQANIRQMKSACSSRIERQCWLIHGSGLSPLLYF
jgi:DNA-binding MltR family transcriptional regulator